MGDFTVKPGNLTDAATELSGEVAPAYGASAQNLRTNGQVDMPGFGIALSWLDAMYRSRLDFIALDLEGAQDIVGDIATALEQTATQFNAAEDLNISGFGGPGHRPASFGESFGPALGNAVAAPAGLAVTLISAGAIYGTSGTLAACAGLSPAFIPAAITATLFIANIPSIADAASVLKAEADMLGEQVNTALSTALSHAANGWEGEGALGFTSMSSELTAHLAAMVSFIDAVGDVLVAVTITLSILWAALAAFAVGFLAWLISMHLASVGPQAPAVQAVLHSTSAALSSTWVVGMLGVGGSLAPVAIVLGMLTDQIAAFISPPDTNNNGTPDMQEFHVDENFDA
ncbi:hypothetical protein [Nocardioides jensenii]|uniref:hypothetical protein n=1 Tax=Nocardioides jensenii TaxID=1843 RepID=UPI00082B3335|nr:hypothetical protein [Nocardioides jensenii]